MAIAMGMSFLIISDLILRLPWLYRLPSPLYYLMFPAAYIYVRMTLLDETSIRKSDYLHAVPALVHLIEMMPFYLRPTSEKLDHILETAGDPLRSVAHAEGWLPAYAHNFIRGLIGVLYALLMVRLLLRSRSKRPSGLDYFPEMMKWLWVHTLMLFGLSLSLVVTIAFPGSGSAAFRSAILYIMMAGTQIVSSLYLLLNPVILFGMPRLEKLVGRWQQQRNDLLLDARRAEIREPAPQLITQQPAPPKVTATEKKDAAKQATNRNYEDYVLLLQTLMEEKKPFLRKRYSLNDLASDLKVPQHHLSYLLNNTFQLRFSDYINQLRLQYIRQRLTNEDLSHMTLEGLALEAGFSSRITFIRVVQKHTGMNPSDYFKMRFVEEEEAEVNSISIN
jgi:AraC-like DNA-binding protein